MVGLAYTSPMFDREERNSGILSVLLSAFWWAVPTAP